MSVELLCVENEIPACDDHRHLVRYMSGHALCGLSKCWGRRAETYEEHICRTCWRIATTTRHPDGGEYTMPDVIE